MHESVKSTWISNELHILKSASRLQREEYHVSAGMIADQHH